MTDRSRDYTCQCGHLMSKHVEGPDESTKGRVTGWHVRCTEPECDCRIELPF
jgi:hypothetical protein